MFATDPYAVAKFRENTHRDKNPSISFNSFICKRCQTPRATSGRKRASDSVKDGWICSECHSDREAKRATKKLLLSVKE